MNPTEPMSFFDTVELPMLRGSAYQGELFRDICNKSKKHTNFACSRRISRHQTNGFILQAVSAEVKCFLTPDVSEEVWKAARFRLQLNVRLLLDTPLFALREGLRLDQVEPMDDRDDVAGAIIIVKSWSKRFPVENSTTWKPSNWPLRPSRSCLVKVSLNGMGRKPA